MVQTLFLLVFLFFLAPQVNAHPGGLDANGGHYCRKAEGCGEYKYNEYHCHTATCTQPGQTQTPANTPTSTPISTTNTPQQTGSVASIQLSEIYPAPNTGEKEWVEVYNPNSQSVDLSNWKFEDGAGSKKSLSGILRPNSWAFFEYSSGWLNNSGDSLNLLNQAGEIIESYTFGKTTKGTAWAKDNNNWQQTTTPTKGSQNQITAPAEKTKKSTNSKSAKSKTTKSKTTSPINTTQPQILGEAVVGENPETELNFASPSFNLAASQAESSPEAQVAQNKKSNFGGILMIVGSLAILAGVGFSLAKKRKWKLPKL